MLEAAGGEPALEPLPEDLPEPFERFYHELRGDVDGHVVPVETALTWLDDGDPRARLTTEDVAVALTEEVRPDNRWPPG